MIRRPIDPAPLAQWAQWRDQAVALCRERPRTVAELATVLGLEARQTLRLCYRLVIVGRLRVIDPRRAVEHRQYEAR